MMISSWFVCDFFFFGGGGGLFKVELHGLVSHIKQIFYNKAVSATLFFKILIQDLTCAEALNFF